MWKRQTRARSWKGPRGWQWAVASNDISEVEQPARTLGCSTPMLRTRRIFCPSLVFLFLQPARRSSPDPGRRLRTLAEYRQPPLAGHLVRLALCRPRAGARAWRLGLNSPPGGGVVVAASLLWLCALAEPPYRVPHTAITSRFLNQPSLSLESWTWQE